MGAQHSEAPSATVAVPFLSDAGRGRRTWWKHGRVVVSGMWGPSGVMRLMRGPPVPPTGYQMAYCLANSNSSTLTTVEMGAMVRRFTATELAPESAYIFKLMIKMRQG